MKIKLNNIEFGEFDVRDDFQEEQIDRLSTSLEEDGQWNPVIVRPLEDGQYELISGHYRVQAAQKADWEKIEATVKDADDEEALFLAMKTNLMRTEMEQKEQGKVLKEMLDKYEISQREMARRLGKNHNWVNRRLKLALDLSDKVAGLLDKEIISNEKATIIAQLDIKDQDKFVSVTPNDTLNGANKKELRKLVNRFQNNTLYTIGYEGKDWETFLSELKDNEIKILLDIRKSAKSPNKTAFSAEMLEERLSKEKIEYIHRDKLGVDFLLQEPYKNNFIEDKCFKDWYNWWIQEKSGIKMDKLTKYIKDSGKTALMCFEKYAKPQKGQQIYCHRYHLANILKKQEVDERDAFSEVSHL